LEITVASTNAGTNARRWLIFLAGATLVVAVSVGAVLQMRNKDEPAPVPVQRADPVLDLLGWIPATDDTRRAFAVWSEDPGGTDGTLLTISAADPFLDRLALTPVPFTLGRSGTWPDRFGYRAREVTSWATTGTGAPVAVLGGAFDLRAIEHKLTDAGYRESSYWGVVFYVLHEVATPSRLFREVDEAGNRWEGPPSVDHRPLWVATPFHQD